MVIWMIRWGIYVIIIIIIIRMSIAIVVVVNTPVVVGREKPFELLNLKPKRYIINTTNNNNNK